MIDPVPIITLLTDFGEEDFFVGAMKGVILSLNPSATVVDITHFIPPHDVRNAAFTLHHAYREFPPGCIHVTVVDPGVGSSRRPILVATPRHFFLGPDNGVFSFVLDEEPVEILIDLNDEHYFRHPVSHTFHGRDILAPVAAWLSRGVHPDCFGPRINEAVRFEIPRPVRVDPAHIRGVIIHVDHFGNLITNVPAKEFPPDALTGAKLVINECVITRFQSHFAESLKEEPFALVGSTGRLEIAVYRDSAERLLNAYVGSSFDLYLAEE